MLIYFCLVIVQVEDWQNRLLDLRQLKTDLMVEEVKTLLQQGKNYTLSSNVYKIDREILILNLLQSLKS